MNKNLSLLFATLLPANERADDFRIDESHSKHYQKDKPTNERKCKAYKIHDKNDYK